jgi:hypothetical protein
MAFLGRRFQQLVWVMTEVLVTASHDHLHHVIPPAERQATLDEIFRAKGAKPTRSADDLACDDLFESNEELDEFIAYTYAARRADLA